MNCNGIVKRYFNKKGDGHFTEDGRGAEIAVDLVLQARAKMSDNKVNGPEGADVSEISSSCLWRRFPLLPGVFRNGARWRHQIRGRSGSWCSCENQMQHQKGEPSL